MLQRTINIRKILDKGASIFLFGARGTGKSSLVRAALDQSDKRSLGSVITIDLLETETFERYLKAPQLLRQELLKAATSTPAGLTVFIDEIQRLPTLLNEIHSLMEQSQPRFRFILTGSSARKLKRQSANMLAGRALSLSLYPLTQYEWPSDLETKLHLGSLPGIAYKYGDEPELAKLALRTYVSTYLREEIQQEALVRRLDAFARFLEIAGQYHAKTIHAAAIAKAAGLSPQTVAEYLQILQDTLVAFKLPGWSASAKKQLRITPKLYLFDNGVANAIRGELNLPLRESTSRYGDLFEAFVMQEFWRANEYRQLDLKMSYWRTNTGVEVDLILSRGLGQPLAAIEIKSTPAPEHKNWRGFDAFRQEYPETPCYCICRCERPYTTEDGVEVMPYAQVEALIQAVAVREV